MVYKLNQKMFRNKNKLRLDYIPSQIFYRELYIDKLLDFVERASLNFGDSKYFMISGSSGSGKTMLINYVIRKLEPKIDKLTSFKVVSINCKHDRTPGMISKTILSKISDNISLKGYSSEEMLSKSLHIIKKNRLNVLIIMENSDIFFKQNPQFIYKMMRLNEVFPRSSCPSIIFTVQNKELLKKIDKEIFGILVGNTFHMKEYNREQIKNVLRDRSSEAFNYESISEKIIDICVEKAYLNKSNIKYAIKLLLLSGTSADKAKCSQIKEEHIQNVSLNIHPELDESDLNNLKLTEKMILLALTDLSETTEFVSMGKLKSQYNEICKKNSIKPINHTWFWLTIRDLADLGFINKRLSGKGMRGRTTLISLPENSQSFFRNILLI